EKDVLFPMRAAQANKPQAQSQSPPRPKSEAPTKQEAVEVMQQAQVQGVREVTKDVRAEFDDILALHKPDQNQDDDEKAPQTNTAKPLPLTPPQVAEQQAKQQALQEARKSPVLAMKQAQGRIDAEEKAFDERKARKNADKKLEKIVEQQNKAK